MRYIIIPTDGVPFYTSWFDVDNNFERGMIVIDTATDKYYSGTGEWVRIKYDQL